jgi:hypothetical protein
MVERGVSIGVIQTFVGLMCARMVRHYTHVCGAARKAVDLLDSDPILVTTVSKGEQCIMPLGFCGEFCGEMLSL